MIFAVNLEPPNRQRLKTIYDHNWPYEMDAFLAFAILILLNQG